MAYSCSYVRKDNDEAVMNSQKIMPKDSVFFLDQLSQDPLLDSLYVLDHVFFADSMRFQEFYRSVLEWNEAAKVYVSAGLTTVIDESLNIQFVDDQTKSFHVKTFDKIPFAITSQERTLSLLNLKEKKVTKRFFLEGNICSGMSKSGNKIIAAIYARKDFYKKNKKHLYDLIFDENDLTKIDTLFQDEGPNRELIYISDNGYKGYIKGQELIVESTDLETNYSIQQSMYGRPILVHSNKAVAIKKVASYEVYSLPTLEKLYSKNYGSHGSILQSTDDIISVGTRNGSARYRDAASGKAIYRLTNFTKVFHIGSNGNNHGIFSDKVDNGLNFHSVDLVDNEILEVKNFRTPKLVYKGISLDSKLLFYTSDDIVYTYHLETKKIEQITSAKTKVIKNIHSNDDHSIYGYIEDTEEGLVIKMRNSKTNQEWTISAEYTGQIRFFNRNQFTIIPLNYDTQPLSVYTIEDDAIKVSKKDAVSFKSPSYKLIYPRGRQTFGYPDWFTNRQYWVNSENDLVKFDFDKFTEEKFKFNSSNSIFGIDSKSNVLIYDRVSEEKKLVKLEDRSFVKKFRGEMGSQIRLYPDLYSDEYKDLLVYNKLGTYYVYRLDDFSKYQIFHGAELHVSPNLEYVIEINGQKMQIYRSGR